MNVLLFSVLTICPSKDSCTCISFTLHAIFMLLPSHKFLLIMSQGRCWAITDNSISQHVRQSLSNGPIYDHQQRLIIVHFIFAYGYSGANPPVWVRAFAQERAIIHFREAVFLWLKMFLQRFMELLEKGNKGSSQV